MAEDEIIDAVSGQVNQFQSISQLVNSSESLQAAFIVLIVGIIGIALVYRTFSKWVRRQKINYVRPHLSRFLRVVVLPFFAIVLITSVNFYIQSFALFENDMSPNDDLELTPSETFAKILNTINILVIGYSIAHLIPIALGKKEKSILEKEDFEIWKELRGFSDDIDDLFHKFYKWVPPRHTPGPSRHLGDPQRHDTSQRGRFVWVLTAC